MIRAIKRLESADPSLVKGLMKLVAGIGIFLMLLLLISFLPGAERVIPSVPLTLGSVLISIVTIGIAGLLIQLAPRIESSVRNEVPDPALGDPGGSIARYLVLFLSVLVAHRGLASATVPFLESVGAGSLYDIAFLVIGLIPLAYITYHLYVVLDPLAGHLSRALTGGTNPEVSSSHTTTEESVQRRPSRTVGLPTISGRDSFTLLRDAIRSRVPQAPSTGTDNGTSRAETNTASEEVFEDVPPEFLPNEDRVITLLDAHGGQMRQTDVVSETGWSKSKVSRVLSEMEESNQIVRVDIGRCNVVTRPDDLPSGARSLINK